MKLWDVRSGSPLRTITVTGEASYTVRVSGRGRYVITSSSDGSLRAWDTKTGAEARTIEASIGYIHDFAFSRDGKRMAFPNRTSVTIWNLQAWTSEGTFDAHEGHTSSLAFHPFGRYLASVGQDGRAKVWDVEARKEVASFEAGEGGGPRIAWGAGGRELIVPGADGTVRIYGVK